MKINPETQDPSIWSHVILLIDMNAFFASIEQRDKPEWRGHPVAITNGSLGTCIITCSYEARAYGIKTGMRLREALQKCPELIQCPANPQRYAQTSASIMRALKKFTPDIEIFSIDEAFLDVTRCQKLLGTVEQIAQQVKRSVYENSGLLCSIGVSGDKTTAKYAAKQNKPNGLTIIPPWEARRQLQNVSVTELCGISHGIARYLAERGIYTCGDMDKLPVSELARRFGNTGRRIWAMCRGEDPDKVKTHISPPKSIGHGKVMPPNTTNYNIIRTYLLHMCEKVAARLRRHQLQAQHFYIGLKTLSGWIKSRLHLEQAGHDGQLLYRACLLFIDTQWHSEGIYQIQVTALDPHPVRGQLALFNSSSHTDSSGKSYQQVMDHINERYGDLSLAPARLLNRSTMPDVIAPSWKPQGHRQSIKNFTDDLK